VDTGYSKFLGFLNTFMPQPNVFFWKKAATMAMDSPYYQPGEAKLLTLNFLSVFLKMPLKALMIYWRTAAVSALGRQYLSRKNASR
jgi:hypothetical protein